MSAPSDERATVDFSNPIDRENAIRVGRAWIELRRGAWTANLREYLYGDDDPLEQGQMDALDLLTRSDRTMRGLAARLRIDPSSATRAVQRLVDDGLAERFPSPDDGRVVMVRITKDGRTRHADVDARRSHTMALILSEFTPHERADLAVMLDRFVDALDHVCERLGTAPDPHTSHDAETPDTTGTARQ
ncbi:MAG: MarR family winged helix-turn-helix transcriptional regulator [Ilumatobacter sp.]|jgi:DNA-binding MarR family transcriptional regulator|uniref:MarR family winged helix-turn-helix transcriptional regulator n=1 Tax=Ilumatobacter sp. TaxID=1967498 RepID=UPI00391D03C2